jgi:hypothetical protein
VNPALQTPSNPIWGFIWNYEACAVYGHVQSAARMHKTLKLNLSPHSDKTSDLFVTPFHKRCGTRIQKPTNPSTVTLKMSAVFG